MTLRLAALLVLALPAAFVPSAAAQSAGDGSALAPGRVQILHNAPDPSLAALDVYINGVRLPGLDDLAFRNASPFIDVSPGSAITVAVARDTSEGIAEALVLASFVAQADTDHRVYIEGVDRFFQFADNPDGLSTRLSVTAVQVRRRANLDPNDSRVTISLRQGVPDLETVRYDAFTSSGSGFFGFDAPYGGGLSALGVPVDDFTLRLRIPGYPEVDVSPGDLGIAGGDLGLLFLSGFADPSVNQGGPALGLFVLRSDGTVHPVATPVADEAPPETVRGGLSVYPNPARHSATVRLPSASFGTRFGAEIEVFDVQGRRIATEVAAPGATEHRLDVANWTPGVYIVHVDTGASHVARTVLSVVR